MLRVWRERRRNTSLMMFFMAGIVAIAGCAAALDSFVGIQSPKYRAAYITEHPNLRPIVRYAISHGEWSIGMTRQDFRAVSAYDKMCYRSAISANGYVLDCAQAYNESFVFSGGRIVAMYNTPYFWP